MFGSLAPWFDQATTRLGDAAIRSQDPFGTLAPSAMSPDQRQAAIQSAWSQFNGQLANAASQGMKPMAALGSAIGNTTQQGVDNASKMVYAKTHQRQLDRDKRADQQATGWQNWAKANASRFGEYGPALEFMDPADGLTFISGLAKGQKPDIIETYDEATGRPVKGYMLGNKFHQVGGVKAPDEDPTKGQFREDVGGNKVLFYSDGNVKKVLGPSPVKQQDVPSAYQWVPGEEGKRLQAIPDGPATKVPAEVAGRLAMIETAKPEIAEAENYFLGKEIVDPKTGQKTRSGPASGVGLQALQSATNSGEYGRARRSIRLGIEAALRAMTGANAPDSEVASYQDMFLPTPTDSIETRTQKLTMLKNFMANAESVMGRGRSQGGPMTAPPPDAQAKGDLERAQARSTGGQAKVRRTANKGRYFSDDDGVTWYDSQTGGKVPW